MDTSSTRGFPIRIDYYQYAAETWESVLSCLDISRIHSIIDLCPGWAPKVEFALIKAGFSGEVIALDQSAENLAYFNHLLSPFKRNFTFSCMRDHLLAQEHSYTADLLIGNHIIDDLLLDVYLTRTEKQFDEKMYQDMEVYKKIWKDLIKNDPSSHIIEQLVHFFLSSCKPGGYIILTQYHSYQEKLYGFPDGYDYCNAVAQKLRDNLVAQGFTIPDTLARAFDHNISPYFSQGQILCLQKPS